MKIMLSSHHANMATLFWRWTKINHVGFQFEMYTIHIMNYESSDERAIVMDIVLR